ncbi:unnamed protein product [Nyctereutes procyonoides]|uniref:(raccoon dog) hypothetical protein n=1 Tax=Nyctereutes procyonoides TaxID=34880 RepID=A0A811ZWR3_NYCPR|nr:unnamed protein product [Nyctereutes procyonoides]
MPAQAPEACRDYTGLPYKGNCCSSGIRFHWASHMVDNDDADDNDDDENDESDDDSGDDRDNDSNGNDCWTHFPIFSLKKSRSFCSENSGSDLP